MGMNHMFTDSELDEITRRKIEQDENLGDQVGGSGHLGHISFEIDKIGPLKEVEFNKNRTWQITFEYTLFVTTEFTYYPDNPPYEYKYSKTITINENKEILEDKPKISLFINPNFLLTFDD